MNVSAIVPTFNRAPFLRESLDSLLGQTVPLCQVVVIDDGSTDETPSIIRSYGSRISAFRKDNGGKSAALNHAMSHVIGSHVWVFDDDDVAYPDALGRHITTLTKKPSLGFSIGNHDWGRTGPDGRILFDEFHEMPKLHGRAIFLNLLRYCFFMHTGAVVRRECYFKVGPFREDLLRSQDYDMAIRLARDFECEIVDGSVYLLRRHSGDRGSAAQRHSADTREVVWRKFDRLIGASIYRDLDLAEYLLQPPNGELTSQERREALLMRAAVSASKGLLDEMIDDLGKASQMSASGPLTRRERDIVASSIDHPGFAHEVKNQDNVWSQLAAIPTTDVGREVTWILLRASYWSMQDKRSALASTLDRWHLSRVMLKLLARVVLSEIRSRA